MFLKTMVLFLKKPLAFLSVHENVGNMKRHREACDPQFGNRADCKWPLRGFRQITTLKNYKSLRYSTNSSTFLESRGSVPCMRFEVLKAVVMKSDIFWNITPRSPKRRLPFNRCHGVISQKIELSPPDNPHPDWNDSSPHPRVLFTEDSSTFRSSQYSKVIGFFQLT
jgi:hypothetical protein